MPVESIDGSAALISCVVRPDPDGKAQRRELPISALMLIVSAPIKRERAKELVVAKRASDIRLDDNWLVHLHFRGEDRPWEIDARRTGFETTTVASAHMNLLELVRRLAQSAPHDETFRSFAPALSPGEDPLTDLKTLSAGRKEGKEPKTTVLDNAAQFREYSAWRGALDALLAANNAPPS